MEMMFENMSESAANECFAILMMQTLSQKGKINGLCTKNE